MLLHYDENLSDFWPLSLSMRLLRPVLRSKSRKYNLNHLPGTDLRVVGAKFQILRSSGSVRVLHLFNNDLTVLV